jgi:sec-independent protein translocase protein TatA
MTTSIVLGFIGGLGGTEIVLIIVVLLLFFGGKRIPELARGLGKGIREFKDASSGKSDENTTIEKKD